MNQKDLFNKIKELSKEYESDLLRIQRHLHKFPELSFEEHKTSAFIQEELKKIGIPFETGFAKTGILSVIEGKNPEKRTIALRADMDALPIHEETDLEFKSVNKGVMHACGHDAHSACLLAAGKILFEFREEFEGRILLVFQPGEELLPGGANLMMKDGVFFKHEPELIIGQHVLPDMKAGNVGFKSGMYMASCDEIYLKVKGSGGHGALPHKLQDTVLIASYIIVAMQQIVSRNGDVQTPSVLSFGRIIGEGATNVIPKEVCIDGTFRTMNEEWRKDAHNRIRKIASSVAEAMGAECEVEIRKGYPSVFNNENLTEELIQLSKEYLGEENVEQMSIRMTAEDFGYFSLKYPSCFYRFGVQTENSGGLHTPSFCLNEKSLVVAAGNMTALALGLMLKK